jgi:hypothetical protein
VAAAYTGAAKVAYRRGVESDDRPFALLLEVHGTFPRAGPGGDEPTRWAHRLVPGSSHRRRRFRRYADCHSDEFGIGQPSSHSGDVEIPGAAPSAR